MVNSGCAACEMPSLRKFRVIRKRAPGADDQTLEIQLWGDPHLQIQVERVDASRRAARRPAVKSSDQGVSIYESTVFQNGAQGRNNLREGDENLRFGLGSDEIALPVTDLDILKACHFQASAAECR